MKPSEVCARMDVAGKVEGMDGSKVAEAIEAGRIQDVADYCAQDVAATYRVFLAYSRFASGLGDPCYFASRDHLEDIVLGLDTLPKHVDVVAEERTAAVCATSGF